MVVGAFFYDISTNTERPEFRMIKQLPDLPGRNFQEPNRRNTGPAPVAQLDRVMDFESRGRRFESCPERISINLIQRRNGKNYENID